MASRPRFHYAFVVVAVVFCVLLIGAGLRGAPGVLLQPLERNFGWTRSQTSLAAAIGIFLYGLVGPFAAALMHSPGVRRVVITALLLMAASTGVSALMTQHWHLIATWGVLSGIASGCVTVVLGATIVNRWFATQRGLVMGLLTASTATGALIFIPGLAWLAQQYGFRAVVLTVARIVDAFTDTFFGWVSDNTRSRWGRRRPYILIGSILSGITCAGAFAA